MPEPQTLLTGLVIGESPRWHEDRLWFCHWGAHEIVAVDGDGNSEVVTRDPQTSPHSIEWLPDGRQLKVPGNPERTGRLLRREPDGSLVPHADLSGLPSGLNEIVVDGRGNIYVNGCPQALDTGRGACY
jgi:sugar lactone lactonase YvrE